MKDERENTVQRTLIMSCGALAAATAEKFGDLLRRREGPAMTVATVDAGEGQVGEALRGTVVEALTHISPPHLATLLARSGWQLAHTADVDLVVVVDVEAGGGERAATLVDWMTAIVYRHLGVEASSLLIWLAGEVAETAVADCVRARIPVTRGVMVLSLRNEAGLRLPDETALRDIGAELLWCLATTPLRALPEQALTQSGEAYTGDVPLISVGLHKWAWSPQATHTAFTRRWLQTVLAHWLARPEETQTRQQVMAWLHAQELSATALAGRVLSPEQYPLPDFAPEAWQAPWPWQINRLLQEMRLADGIDRDALSEKQQAAVLHLDEPLQEAREALGTQAQTMLDARPVEGVARVCAWLHLAADACGEQYEQLLDEDESRQVTGAHLAAERGRLAAQIGGWLESWPAAGPAWLPIGLRPWRWPALAWRYRQLRQAGQQLSRILGRQARLRRQALANAVARRAAADLERIIRHLHGQVEEIGDMLQYLAAETAANPSGSPQEEPPDAASIPAAMPPIPGALYEQLVPDEAAEAVAAAAAVGGLGPQMKALDDTIVEPLWRYGKERLAAVWSLTAVDALAAVAGEERQLRQKVQEGWDAACPLWRHDEARLPEPVRARQHRLAVICGAGARLLADMLPAEIDHSLQWWESGDRQRLWLVRAHSGLVPEALALARETDSS